MGFKDNLKMLRKSKKLSQKDFGKLIDKTLLTVSRYENGQLFPKHNTLLKICEVLNVTSSQILLNIEYEKRNYSFDEIKNIMENHSLKNDEIIKKINTDILNNNSKILNIFAGKETLISDIINDITNRNNTILNEKISRSDLEKNFNKDLKNNIYNFYLLLKYDLLLNKNNLSFDNRLEIFNQLKKYYEFLISDYINKS